MKKLIFIVLTIAFSMTFTSCGSLNSIQKNENDLAGYTLKNKKELMEHKVLNKKIKTVVVLP